MTTSTSNTAIGVALAIFATLSWALNFIAPYVTGGYSIYDLMALRFLFAGVLGVLIVGVYRAQVRLLRADQWLRALGLGAMGYLGYSTCIAAGVIIAGPLLTPALIGMVPVLLALLGNARSKTLAWRRLATPLAFLVSGLLLTNLSAINQPGVSAGSFLTGLIFSLLAVVLWIVFSLLNQTELEKLPPSTTAAWTGLMMTGGAIGTLGLLPLGLALEVFKLPSLGFDFASAGHLYAWALLIAVLCSLIGAWAWNLASRYLPMVLSGQLIALESLFATLLGLIFHGRLPTLMEALGLVAVLTGAVLAVRVILAPLGSRVVRLKTESSADLRKN
ncbi:DMT family transporter [Pseudomonas fluorescens]|uniref:Inner membrane protein YtfF n=1 Tax=Pseudomonas fluorescens TaxID=294 RepID=A0A5E7CPI7_PSEFL|nr:DMT family transporter [Pseudomonas fluorescens]VVO06847.1 Inner membrane protein YtfF [Pseudomonas fluorescens]